MVVGSGGGVGGMDGVGSGRIESGQVGSCSVESGERRGINGGSSSLYIFFLSSPICCNHVYSL